MALADSGKAIGAVTRLLVSQLQARMDAKGITFPGAGGDVVVGEGRPEPPADEEMPYVRRLNLFLYEVVFDSAMKNVTTDDGRPAPLWLVLKYLMTAFDDEMDSDSAKAQEILGEAVASLQEMCHISPDESPDSKVVAALGDNPEPLKITFDATPSDLLSRVMQGSDEKYRLSVGFQVRPVMITTGQPPAHSLLVGVDYTAEPSAVVGEEAVQIPVLPSMGPATTQVVPSKVEVGDELTIVGTDLGLSGLAVQFGGVELPVTSQRPDRLTCQVPASLGDGDLMSAGSHSLRVVQTLSTGRIRPSNLLVESLLPTLGSPVTVGTVTLHEELSDGTRMVYGDLTVAGTLLGTSDDDVSLSLYRDGAVVRAFDDFAHTPDQKTLTLNMTSGQSVPEGTYRVILRVNGQQAKSSPEVQLVES